MMIRIRTSLQKKAAVLLVLCWSSGLLAAFSASDLSEIRRIADKFTVSADQKQNFLDKARALVGSVTLATAEQRNELIETLEDARYGGSMDDIITLDGGDGLEALLTSAKASTPGASGGGTSSDGTVAPSVSSVIYSERIEKLSKDLAQFKFKQSTEVERTSFYQVMAQLVADRGDSFADERLRLEKVLSNSRFIIFRSDETRKQQVENELIPQLEEVSFAMRLDRLELLYERFSPLTPKESTRIQRHLKELAEAIDQATADEHERFQALLEFVQVTFFDNDTSARGKIDEHLKVVEAYDPASSKPYIEQVQALQESASLTSSSDVQDFVDKVEVLVNKRYGVTEEDKAKRTESQVALQALLQTMSDLPNFSSQSAKVMVLLGLVKADQVTNEMVSYESRIEDHEEMVLETNDATKRAAFMTSLEALVQERYGSTEEDNKEGQRDKNQARLARLLRWLKGISWFSDELSKLDTYLSQVESGSIGSSSASSDTSAAPVPITYVFDALVEEQVGKLEFALNNAATESDKELFMYSLYNAIERKNTAKTTDHNRIRAMISTGKTGTRFNFNYNNDFDFFLAAMDDNVSDSDRYDYRSVLLERSSKVAAPSALLQARFIKTAQVLVARKAEMDDTQKAKVDQALTQVRIREIFTAEYTAKVFELQRELGVTDPSAQSNQSATNNDPNETDAQASSDTTDNSASSTTTQTETDQISEEEAQARARAYLSARRRRARR